jgi:hypothetical protein
VWNIIGRLKRRDGIHYDIGTCNEINTYVDINFSAHDAFVEQLSSMTLNINTLESQAIHKCLWQKNQRAQTGQPQSAICHRWIILMVLTPISMSSNVDWLYSLCCYFCQIFLTYFGRYLLKSILSDDEELY